MISQKAYYVGYFNEELYALQFQLVEKFLVMISYKIKIKINPKNYIPNKMLEKQLKVKMPFNMIMLNLLWLLVMKEKINITSLEQLPRMVK